MAYNGTINVISGFRAKNNGTFPLVDAKDVFVTDEKRLDVAIEEFDAMNSQQNQQIAGLQENTSATGGLLDLVNARVTAIENTKVVKTVNGTEPDENGNVAVEGGSDITVDDTLTIEGAAADAKAVSDALSTLLQNVSASYGDLRSDLTTLDESAVKTVNGVAPDDAGNVVVEGGSGGVSSWNDLTDKPFYEEGEWVTFVENETISGEFEREATVEEYTLFNTIGTCVKVTFDGKEYESTTRLMSDGRDTLVGCGNIEALMGSGDTGEPFLLAMFNEEGSYVLIIHSAYDIAGSTTNVISVSLFDGVRKTLDAKFHDDTHIRTIVEKVISKALEGDY